MFEILACCVLIGVGFQEHKSRVAEWSGWHPMFKYIVLLINWEMDCGDCLLLLWILLIADDLVKYNFYLVVIYMPTCVLSLLICGHHIYRPDLRWAWCYLHSSIFQFFWKRWATVPANNLLTDIWLDNVENRARHYDRLPDINLIYLPFICLAWYAAPLSLRLEWCMPMDGVPEWNQWGPILFFTLMITQLNIVCEYPRKIPRFNEICPTLRVFRGFSLYGMHFLKWDVFAKERIPWKFFNLMNLQRLFEFAPQERTCLVSIADSCVATMGPDPYAQCLSAYTSDQYIWPHLKPMTEKGTYRYTRRCVYIYDMSW